VVHSFQNFVEVGFVLNETSKVLFSISFYLHQKVVPVTQNN